MGNNLLYGLVIKNNQPYIITMLSDIKVEDVREDEDFYIGTKDPDAKVKTTMVLFSPDDCDFNNIKIAKFYGKE